MKAAPAYDMNSNQQTVGVLRHQYAHCEVGQ